MEGNILSRLRSIAAASPERAALVFPIGRGRGAASEYRTWTYAELDRVSDRYGRGLATVGIARGTRAIVMLKPGPELFALVFALFKLGAIPVIVDPGMGPKRMLHCYETVGAEAFIGIPLAHLVRLIRPRSFATARILVTVGGPKLWGGHALADLAIDAAEPLALAPLGDDDTLVINFTTGSTGPARGVEYTHGGVAAMIAAMRSLYGDVTDATSLITLPLFALFDMLLGHTAVLAPMNPTRPADANARRLAHAIATFGCTHMFASPALLHRVGQDAAAAGLTLPSLRVVISGGAPVMPRIIEQFRTVLAADARVFATYGATEALPMAHIESRELLTETRRATAAGQGTCIGRPTEGLAARIVPITDTPMPVVPPAGTVAPGAVGELAVRGAIVSPRYHADPRNDALAKMADGERAWHRTGDLGWQDERGRLWFAGRKSDRVVTARGTLFTVQCEGVFDDHPEVHRSALVGVGPRGAARPVLCIEPAAGVRAADLARLEQDLQRLAKAHPVTRDLETVLFHPRFPVDIRHNAKIGRDELTAWAAQRVAPVAGATPRRRSRLAMNAIPIAGWLYILYGACFPLPHPILHVLWIIDLILSIGVHGLQLVAALPRGKRAGYPAATIVFMTFLLGATWWKFLEPRELRGRNRRPAPEAA